MAGRRRRSPRQKAALRKAQLASARKRRRRSWSRNAKAVGSVVGGIATSAALYHVNSYARNPSKAIKDYKTAKSFIDRKRGKTPALTPGLKTKPRKKIGYYPSNKAQSAALRRRTRVR